MNIEKFLFFLIPAAIVFVGVVLPWLGKRIEHNRRGDRGNDGRPAVQVADPALSRYETAAAPPVHARAARRATGAVSVHDSQTGGRPVRLAPLIRPGEARRGIVLAAILGPCRALEPFNGP